MRSALACALWAVAAICQIAAPPAAAGTLEVAPTTVVFGQAAKTGVLYVNNYGSMPVTVQIEPFDWSQSGGKDRLVTSDALMVSPPIAAIPPQGKQTVRLMIAPAAGAGERSFRLLISELPDRMKRVDHSVQVLTQFSVPVFAAGTDRCSGKLVWEARLGGGELKLTARNEGPCHAKLAGLDVVARRRQTLADGKRAQLRPGGQRPKLEIAVRALRDRRRHTHRGQRRSLRRNAR